ncbi:Gfo/Idh/MocA family protein [Lysinibacillus sp. NPDC096212]|uniref:Gfo/Idh/MocA family protein n=1 Tax=Lysinibacillus sp. NPDC096212 TaxID=3364135 RepID=UPI003815DEDC
MKALVIGYGSIGQRHARILEYMGFQVYIVSRRAQHKLNFFSSLETALKENKYDYIVIANETVAHIESLREIINYKFTGMILVEKPLFAKVDSVSLNDCMIFVAYNLRFHPLILQLKTMLFNEQTISVNAYVGQYLPTWRPNIDYTKCYSAYSNQGGGVLRDLSHELDYLTYLFGEWNSLVANTAKISNLNIQSEDYTQVSYRTNQDIHVSVELNYLDRIDQRYVIVQTNNKTIKIDFIDNSINCNGEIEQLATVDRDYTYMKQHEAILNDSLHCCSFKEGLNIVKMIEAIEKSSIHKEWVYND